jgi:hypothetical protein
MSSARWCRMHWERCVKCERPTQRTVATRRLKRERERAKERILDEIVEQYNAVLTAKERKSKKKVHE